MEKQAKSLTVREINALTRDGGNGRNVYAHFGSAEHPPMLTRRVTRARTRKGRMEVRLLGGDWVDASEAKLQASL